MLLIAGLGACSDEAPPAPAKRRPIQAVLVTATGNEPAAHLPSGVVDEFRAVGLTEPATEGYDPRLVVAVAGRTVSTVDLRPRRGDGSIDVTADRARRVDVQVQAVQNALGAAASSSPELDLLTGINTVTRFGPPGSPTRPNRLTVLSSGLQTADPLDLNVLGWQQDPDQVARKLTAGGWLGDWRGWRIVFAGLGDSVDPQPEVPAPQRETLIAYWLAICNAAGADCSADPEPPSVTPGDGARVPVVTVPSVRTDRGPAEQLADLPSDLLFGQDSATLRTGADLVLAPLAATARALGRRLCIEGTADAATGTPRYNKLLSEQRARAVRDRLVELGLPAGLIACLIGAGADPHSTLPVAEQRRVRITTEVS